MNNILKANNKLLKHNNSWAYFNGSSSYIQYADNDIFSFTDGVNDIPFEVEFDIMISSYSTAGIIVNKRSEISTNCEWQISYSSTGLLSVTLFNGGTNAIFLSVRYNTALILNIPYHIKITYDGSKLWTGIKIDVNNVPVVLVNTSIGAPYIGMINGTAPMKVGRSGYTTYSHIVTSETLK